MSQKQREIEQNEKILQMLEDEENKLIKSLNATLQNEDQLRNSLAKEKKLGSPVRFPIKDPISNSPISEERR